MTKIKDPSVKRPYDWDWSTYCTREGTDLVTAEWSVTPDDDTLTIEASPPPSITGNVATVWLSGGTLNARYEVVCSISTESGIEDEQWSEEFLVQNK